ncbi:hypothetical protein PPERSA_07069 [Pseudocohnilembus persalinus]|uniref:Transmembrane protein n=1 Tax=Pseudocohnilembus persalinus TaxID=266149 RepID=A0A0V0QAU8_PSEPJ|nr:hypothetical protein PPERSA_07069 [Pseudocohnilembus persalinus]|eukprot:KRW99297.1 hypothetical protein PPERSA_07069 [Pseudocohnilembus persalinus]
MSRLSFSQKICSNSSKQTVLGQFLQFTMHQISSIKMRTKFSRASISEASMVLKREKSCLVILIFVYKQLLLFQVISLEMVLARTSAIDLLEILFYNFSKISGWVSRQLNTSLFSLIKLMTIFEKQMAQVSQCSVLAGSLSRKAKICSKISSPVFLNSSSLFSFSSLSIFSCSSFSFFSFLACSSSSDWLISSAISSSPSSLLLNFSITELDSESGLQGSYFPKRKEANQGILSSLRISLAQKGYLFSILVTLSAFIWSKFCSIFSSSSSSSFFSLLSKFSEFSSFCPLLLNCSLLLLFSELLFSFSSFSCFSLMSSIFFFMEAFSWFSKSSPTFYRQQQSIKVLIFSGFFIIY